MRPNFRYLNLAGSELFVLTDHVAFRNPELRNKGAWEVATNLALNQCPAQDAFADAQGVGLFRPLRRDGLVPGARRAMPNRAIIR
jgi:hypothetical protein